MARIQIPKNPGIFKVITSYAGTPLVINHKAGAKSIRIPCKTQKQAEDLCERLNRGDYNGQVYSQS